MPVTNASERSPLRRIRLLGALALLAAPALAEPALSKTDVLTWPRARADAFGCFLEKSFAIRDPRFNCALKGYVNNGDPCKNVDAYVEGPKFPDGEARLIDPSVASVELTWEHGELQSVELTLKKAAPEARVRRLFQLPAKGAPSRANVMSVDVQQCGKDATCLAVQGFDHMGAGDVDCGGE